MTKRSSALLTLFLGSWAANAAAQSRPAMPGRLELSAGVLWSGGAGLGSQDADLTTGTNGTLRLFASDSEAHGAAGLEVRIGARLAQAIDLEALASYAQPRLETRITNDIENSAVSTASETMQQYTIGGGVVWYPRLRKPPTRVLPFVSGGVSYLRQLHEGATLVATGESYHIGGGAKLLMATRTRRNGWKTAGVRLDALAIVRTAGASFDGRRTISAAVGASFLLRF